MTLTPELCAKIAKSKTTAPFLQKIHDTRNQLFELCIGELRHEEEICDPDPDSKLQGHPDFRTDTQIFECKLTGQLKKNWQYFLFQVFAYAALAPEITDVYLVLPLQKRIWHHDVRGWSATSRKTYRDFMMTAIRKKIATTPAAYELIAECSIGEHRPNAKTLADTVRSLPSAPTPSQIFFSGPQSSKFEISDADLSESAALVQSRGITLFIHSQYIINLCMKSTADNDAYGTRLLCKNLQYATAIGARGVVVHVGKSTTQTVPVAIAAMCENLREAVEFATADCPILLETPAGQGTEVLRTWADFAGFVAEFNDPRLRICVDTCHVFATGHQPLNFIKELTEKYPGFTQLIHFNDSATPCGSCVDRHAFIGQGHVGIDQMCLIAHYAKSYAIPMIIE